MRKSVFRTTLRVEAVQARWLPSGVTPVLTSQRYDTVAADVVHVVARLVRTHDAARAAGSLTRLSTRIPFGSVQLASAWMSDLASYNLAVPGSGRAYGEAPPGRPEAGRRRRGRCRRAPRDREARRRLPRPGLGAPQSSLDSVRVANNTSLTLTVTVTLNNTGRSIPRTIPSGGAPALFDFGTASGNFMMINIRNANGASPPPYTTGLNRPISGYNGAMFRVSVFAGYFSVGS